MDHKKIKQMLKETGHWDYPFGEHLPLNARASLKSQEGRYRLESYAAFMTHTFQSLVAQDHPERAFLFPRISGDIEDPDLQSLLEVPRCWVADYGPETMIEAVGAGPWKRCHGIGDFHACSVIWTNGPPAHLNVPFGNGKTVWEEVLTRVRAAYDEIGLRFYFDGPGSPFKEGKTPNQIKASWVGSSAGWIGLAQIGNNGLGCSANQLWCQYLATWKPSSNLETLVRYITVLVLHELGHNCGLGHTSGGIMNPSILLLLGRWIGDVAESWMKNRFGGVRIPSDTPPPPEEEESYTTTVRIRSDSKIHVEVFPHGPWE